MKKTLSKKEAETKIEEFFKYIQEKTPKEIKKIKRLAMSHNIKLGEKRKTFCNKCYNPYLGPSIRVNKGIIKIVCDQCNSVSRWKVK